jgi:hypothetical protein
MNRVSEKIDLKGLTPEQIDRQYRSRTVGTRTAVFPP